MYYADETNILEDRVERAEAEVARLREVVAALVHDTASLFVRTTAAPANLVLWTCTECGRAQLAADADEPFPHNEGCPIHIGRAALSAPDADWLEQHDAEVRREERERCAELGNHRAKQYETTALQRRDDGRGISATIYMARAAEAAAYAAAIREQESTE